MPDNDLQGEFVINNNKLEEEAETPVAEKVAADAPPHAGGKLHFFSNFCINPQNLIFEEQVADEQIVLLIRRDLITNFPWIFATAVLIIIPILIRMFSFLFTPFFVISDGTLQIAVLFYYLIVIGFVLVQFTLWYFNVGLVTTRRIIDFNIAGILYKQISETKINLVEDVSYSQNGAVRSVFDYGDVLIQTAATLENFEFDRVPSPVKIVKIIADMIGEK
ncbi:MAG TPA: hypothetical protein VG965_07235 [Patescibacteria group bacterium]|nr:hypothetical protein [Patescibacteria group bacterium]